MLRNTRWLLIANMLMVVVLVLVACVSPAPPPTATPVPGEPPPPPEPTPTPLPPWGTAEVKNPGTKVGVTIGDAECLDPAWSYESFGIGVENQVYESPVFYEREKYDAFVPMLATEVPSVENGGVSEDALTYTFHIREGVKFHEGGDLTPEDLAYSLWRFMLQDRDGGPAWILLEPFTGFAAVSQLVEDVGGQEYVDAEDVFDMSLVDDETLVATCELVKETVTFDDDEGTVTLHLAAPFGPMLNIMASWVGAAMDMEWVAANGGWDGDCATWQDHYNPFPGEENPICDKMNGTGPYVLEEWVPTEQFSFFRNEDYWRTEPIWDGGPSGIAQIERVVIVESDEWADRLAMIQAGDADSVYVPREFVAQIDPLVKEWYDPAGDADPSALTIKNEEGTLRLIKGYSTLASDHIFFTFDITTEGGNPAIGSGELDGNGIPTDFFSDIHVRRAFNYCFDWPTFIADIMLGEASQAVGPIPEGVLGYNPDQETWYFDLEKCEEEFMAAWDGAVWENGFKMTLYYNEGNTVRQVANEILIDNIGSVNEKFVIENQSVPWADYIVPAIQGRLPAFLIGWIEDYHHPHNWVQPFMSCFGTFSAWQRIPEEICGPWDEAMADALKLVDPVEQEQAYFALVNEGYEQAIDIFIHQALGRHYEQLWMSGWYNNPVYTNLGYWYALAKGS